MNVLKNSSCGKFNKLGFCEQNPTNIFNLLISSAPIGHAILLICCLSEEDLYYYFTIAIDYIALRKKPVRRVHCTFNRQSFSHDFVWRPHCDMTLQSNWKYAMRSIIQTRDALDWNFSCDTYRTGNKISKRKSERKDSHKCSEQWNQCLPITRVVSKKNFVFAWSRVCVCRRCSRLIYAIYGNTHLRGKNIFQ